VTRVNAASQARSPTYLRDHIYNARSNENALLLHEFDDKRKYAARVTSHTARGYQVCQEVMSNEALFVTPLIKRTKSHTLYFAFESTAGETEG
jgi:hypothetical protein